MRIFFTNPDAFYANQRPGAILAVCLFACTAMFRAVSGNSYTSSAKRSAMQDFRNYEVIIPRIYNWNRTLNTTAVSQAIVLPGDILVEFSAFNRMFSLRLIQNKYLFGPNYTEKSVEGSEEQYHDTRNESHCYYIGHVVGQPTSMVAVSTCGGLRGYIKTGNDSFHLDPWGWSPSGRHYVFRDSDYIGPTLFCGHQGKNLNVRVGRRSLDSIIEKKLSTLNWAHDNRTRVVELYVTNDEAQFASLRYNTAKVFKRLKEIVNIVSSFYYSMNIYISLVGAEVWTRGDKMEVGTVAEKVMHSFLEYRRYQITPKHHNDNAQLITGRTFSQNIAGKAPIMTICSQQYSGGVISDGSMLVGPAAIAMAHQLGHNFGLLHDTDLCKCEDNQCMMDVSSGARPKRWSECSKQQFADAFHQGMDYCLLDSPQIAYGSAICGNGVVEEGEDCDCGLPEDCSNYCCNAALCKLMSNATCAQGECCDLSTCELKAVTSECRSSVGDCDLSEYCDGVSEQCPSNVFAGDGRQCWNSGVKSYCYKGQCSTRDSQCQFLWGTTGKASHKLCFERYNILGNFSGHCGWSWNNGRSTFNKCEPQDSLCGMLHCHHLNEKLMFWKESLAYFLPEAVIMVDGKRFECKGAVLDVGLDMPDPGMVPDGATCGEGKVCLNQQCQDVESVFVNSCPDCHGHGVCNSIGQCHCYEGYAPPFCDRPGNRGSLHGGPIRTHHPPTVVQSNVHLTVGLCIFFLIILPLLLLLAFCGFRHRQTIKHFWIRRKPEKYSSVENVNICTTDSFEATLPEPQKEECVVIPTVEDVAVQPTVLVVLPKVEPPTRPLHSPPLPLRPMSVVIRPNPPSEASQPKRASAITTQDISSPQFVSSTNISLDSTLPLSKIRRGEFHGLRQMTSAEHGSDVTNNTDEFQIKTLPNRSSKSRIASSVPQDKSVRKSCIEPSTTSRCGNKTLPAEPVAVLNKPLTSLLSDFGLDENVYEEINLPPPVCPKIPPPNPPLSQQSSVDSQTPQTRRESRVGIGPISKSQSRTSTRKRSDAGLTDGRKPKSKASSNDVEKGSREPKSKPGATDEEKGSRVARRPRQNSSRASQRSSTATSADGSLAAPVTSASGSSGSDLRRPRVTRERPQR